MSSKGPKVEIYKKANGERPFPEWMARMRDHVGEARIDARITRIMSSGNYGDCQPVGEGVSELRVHEGPGYRVYFGQLGEELVVILCGGTKRTQDADIPKAQALWADYKDRRAKAKEAKKGKKDGAH